MVMIGSSVSCYCLAVFMADLMFCLLAMLTSVDTFFFSAHLSVQCILSFALSALFAQFQCCLFSLIASSFEFLFLFSFGRPRSLALSSAHTQSSVVTIEFIGRL